MVLKNTILLRSDLKDYHNTVASEPEAVPNVPPSVKTDENWEAPDDEVKPT